MKELPQIVRKSVIAFLEDGCPSQAAALSYYTIFSLPPLLLIVVSVAGSVFGDTEVRNRVQEQVHGLAGPQAAGQIEAILIAVRSSQEKGGTAAMAVGILTLLLAATTAFAQLQAALNQAWNVKPDPEKSEVLHFFTKRLISFGMILGIAFLTVVSLLLSAVLVAFADFMNSLLPSGLSAPVLRTTTDALSLVIFSALFAVMHKFLPDAQINWRDALLGGAVTALLFEGGKLVIGFYLGNSDVTSVYGAAGSLAVILIWTYYSSMILLLGAEFTQVWTQREGRHVHPEPGAVKVKTLEVRTG